ncbi:NUDIX hydrolase [Cellulomonas cellasea]|uniref:8-oxo-dGTP pyrophosphatase MutT (NUDIX family) n=1 Tax=Cellulomonas cellasea TaxID=43670 RepID=A0A7W4UH11_9CELL|nr:NUDIX domain-containing protein [Cellulomonas cellasea]MBB2924012.1 8-oxo-dGTP pyrophosphatase MutT (NUDIX family) [Cellulomonas cellasea]
MANGPRHSVSVAAAVLAEDGKVLAIQRRDNGHWEPPGGVLELDEGPIDGLRREILEETGLLVEPVALSGVYKNLSEGIVALVFRCRVSAGTAHVTEETAKVAWLDRGQVLTRMNEAFAIRITDALDFAGIPAVRTHDGKYLRDNAPD